MSLTIMSHDQMIMERPIDPKVRNIDLKSLQDSQARFATAQQQYVDSHTSSAMLEALQGPAPFAAVKDSAALSTYRERNALLTVLQLFGMRQPGLASEYSRTAPAGAQVDAVKKSIEGDLSEVSSQRQILRDVSHQFATSYGSAQRKQQELVDVKSEIAALRAELAGGIPCESDSTSLGSSLHTSVPMSDAPAGGESSELAEAKRATAEAVASASAAERRAIDAKERASAVTNAAESAEARAAALERAASERASRQVSSAQQVANAKAWYEAAAEAGDRLLGVKVLEAHAERVCLQVRGKGGPRRLAIGLRSVKGRRAAGGGRAQGTSSGAGAGAALGAPSATDPSGYGGVLQESIPVWATITLPGRDQEDEEAAGGWLDAAVDAAAALHGDSAPAIPAAQWVVLEVLKRI